MELKKQNWSIYSLQQFVQIAGGNGPIPTGSSQDSEEKNNTASGSKRKRDEDDEEQAAGGSARKKTKTGKAGKL